VSYQDQLERQLAEIQRKLKGAKRLPTVDEFPQDTCIRWKSDRTHGDWYYGIKDGLGWIVHRFGQGYKRDWVTLCREFLVDAEEVEIVESFSSLLREEPEEPPVEVNQDHQEITVTVLGADGMRRSWVLKGDEGRQYWQPIYLMAAE